MKAIITLFITMVVLNSILSESYDLVNGTEKQISELKTKENYKLYIEAIKYYGATISLAMKSTSSEPLNYIYVYEYSKNITLRYLRKNSYSVSTKKINNELIFSLDYLVDDQNTKYLAIEIIPDYDMDYMKIKIDLEQTVYDLTDGVPQKIKLLKKEYSYYLYIKSTESQSDLFRIITYKNKMNSKFNVYEFNEKSLYYTKPTQVDVDYSIEDGNNVVSFKYFTKNYETQYVALELQPNYDIEIEVTVDVVGGAFDLSKNVPKKINNLRESVFYFFYFPSTKYYSQTFNLTMNYMTTQPFEML